MRYIFIIAFILSLFLPFPLHAAESVCDQINKCTPEFYNRHQICDGWKCCGNLSDDGTGNCIQIGPQISGPASKGLVCQFIPQLNEQNKCKDCITKNGAWTAIGCVNTDPAGFIKQLIPFAIGIAGGIAFLLMLFGALQMMTSGGNPEKLSSGKELITSALSGLLLIIFSVFLLRLIGYTILGIPGFQ